MRIFYFRNFKSEKGMATFEIMIAMALIVILISSIMPLVSGSQSASVSSQTNQEALYKARNLLEDARATAQGNFASVITSSAITEIDPPYYRKQTIVDPNSITQCGKNVIGNVSWDIENRDLAVNLTTHLGDKFLAMALGGNCDNSPPLDGWNPPDTWSCGKFNPGQPTSLDSLNGVVYMGSDQAPYFYINDTNGAIYNPSCNQLDNPPFVVFANSFEDDEQINDIKVIKHSDGNTYALVARNVSATTVDSQFEIIDVDDTANPFSLSTLDLSNVDITGSEPHGYKLFYFENKVYIVTRETAGPEFHVIDISIAGNPVEIGSGVELTRTVEDLVVTKKVIGGVPRYFIYMAAKSTPLSIFEVDPSTGALTELSSAEPIFTNYQDGRSVFLLGDKLYFGRDSDPSGADLFVYDVSNPLSGSVVPLLASANVGTGVESIFVSGPLAFLGTPHASAEFKVWRSDTDNFVSYNTNFNFPNSIVPGTLKYEKDWIYIAATGNDPLRILYDGLP